MTCSCKPLETKGLLEDSQHLLKVFHVYAKDLLARIPCRPETKAPMKLEPTQSLTKRLKHYSEALCITQRATDSKLHGPQRREPSIKNPLLTGFCS